jgi:paraquat-inducible protein B
MDEASKALLMAERLFDDDSPVLFEVKNTLKALASAARSVGNMADYIERHPDALLYGKAEAKGR